MGLLARLRGWIDRDWERRRYNPTFAFAQRLFWFSPFLIMCVIGVISGAGPGDLAYDWGIPIGLALSLMTFGWSSIRWLKGAGRTAWNEEQARRRKRSDAAD